MILLAIILCSCNNGYKKEEFLMVELLKEFEIECDVSLEDEDSKKTCSLNFKNDSNILSENYTIFLSNYLKKRFNDINIFKFRFVKDDDYFDYKYEISNLKKNDKQDKVYEYCLREFKSFDFYTFDTAIKEAHKNLPKYTSNEEFYKVINDFILNFKAKGSVSSRNTLASIYIFYRDSKDEDLRRLSEHVENIWKITSNDPQLDLDKETVLLFKAL